MNTDTIEVEAEVVPAEKQLQLTIANAEVSVESADSLEKSFSEFFEEAEGWRKKGLAIFIEDASQLKEMKLAREIRLKLRAIRVAADKTRKSLKEDSLRFGRAVDGINNVLKLQIEPVEEHLMRQEQFAERMEAERIEALRVEREKLLAPYGFDATHVLLGDMTGEQFEKLHADTKAGYENRIAAEKKAEEERVAREKAEAEEREKQRAENERLRAEADKREAEIAAERAKVEAERREAEEKARKEREEIEAKAKAERTRLQAIAETERQRAAAIEEKEREREQAEANRIASEEKARQAALKAPDADKLRAFVERIRDVIVPVCSTDEGNEVAAWAGRNLGTFTAKLSEKIELL